MTCMHVTFKANGNGMTVGEEHEQVFSKLSRHGYITKNIRKNGNLVARKIFCECISNQTMKVAIDIFQQPFFY